MAQVIKIEYEKTLRRITFQKETGSGYLSFTQLESRIRELFQISASSQLVITYRDKENDVVTMANDQDIEDAIDHQSLNPLRLYVTLENSKSSPDLNPPSSVERSAGAIDAADAPLKQLLNELSLTTPETLKQMIQPYGDLFRGVTSPSQIPSLVEDIVQTITSQIASVVKSGAAASEISSANTKTPNAVGISAPEPADAVDIATAPGTEKDEGASSKNIVHHGVTCDLCGVSPIVGIRWKSNKWNDYDLCDSCFEKQRNVDDYIKIDQPMFRPRHCHGPYGKRMGGRPQMGSFCGPTVPHSFGGRGLARGPFGSFGGRHYYSPIGGPMRGGVGGKLDARFVTDVTIFDGTEIAPGVHFTKIWRLRNSGNLSWPAHTSLVHVGGDDLGHHSTAEPLEIAPEGLLPGGELDVSVDLVAPGIPGRYVSHWRLASPAGPKFGHRIWALIQVVPKESLDQPANANVGNDPARGEEQKSSPVTTGSAENLAAKEEVPKQLKPLFSFGDVEEPTGAAKDIVIASTEARTPEVEGKVDNGEVGGEFSIVDVAVRQEQSAPIFEVEEKPVEEVEKPLTNSGLDAAAGEGPITYPVVDDGNAKKGPITYPVVDDGKAKKGPITYPVVDDGNAKNSSPAESQDLSTLEGLLAKLNAMGFTDSKLNVEILENNNLDLRATLDDLCAAEEWDPILQELEEMGFYDTEMNRRLMFKSKGSVKRVVKELVHMSRDSDVKGKKVATE